MVFVAGVEPVVMTESALFIAVQDNMLLGREGAPWHPLNRTAFAMTGLKTVEQHFLGYLDQQACWVVEVATETQRPASGFQWLRLRSQLGIVAEDIFLLAGRAIQIVQWYKDHQYCGRCGRPTVTDQQERAKICHACSLHFYPRLSPCIITLITRGTHCLLARHARASQPVFSALAGFIEVGERPEDTVHREVREETGIEIHSVRYFASQPWPFPGQLMLGFTAEYLSGDIQIDGHEIIEADWFRYDCLPQIPPAATLSGQLIEEFVRQQSQESHFFNKSHGTPEKYR